MCITTVLEYDHATQHDGTRYQSFSLPTYLRNTTVLGTNHSVFPLTSAPNIHSGSSGAA
jgi:hypothetical protein